MSTLDDLFDQAEKGGGTSTTVDDLFDQAEAQAKPKQQPFMGMQQVPNAPALPKRPFDPMMPSPPAAADATSAPGPTTVTGPDTDLEKPGFRDMLMPGAITNVTHREVFPVPDGHGGMTLQRKEEKEGMANPLTGSMGLMGAGTRALGAAADPILPWDARGQNADGSQKSFTQAMANPEAGLAKPVREKLGAVIADQLAKATDAERPYIQRVGNTLLAELAGVGLLGASTVEDPMFLGPLAAGTKTAARLSDAAGRGLQKLGGGQLYKKLKPGIRDEKKGFDIEKVFEHNLDRPEGIKIFPGGTIDDIVRNSNKEIKAASDEMKARIQAGADEGARVDVPAEIDNAIRDIVQNPRASKENMEVAGFLKSKSEEIKEYAKSLTPDGSGLMDLMEAQYFKQIMGDRGAWHSTARKKGFNILKNESEESQTAEKIYRHLNDVVDDMAPEGIRDLNRKISELIPIRQAAAHRKIVEDRNNRFGINDMISFAATMHNPLAGAALYGANKASKSGRVASALYRLGEKLRTAKTSAEKTRYIAALKKLGATDDEIAAGVDVVEASGGEKAFQNQDLRIEKPKSPTPEKEPPPPNAVPFRRKGQPDGPVPRTPQRTMAQEPGEGPILNQLAEPPTQQYRPWRDLEREGSADDLKASDRFRDLMDETSGKDNPRIPKDVLAPERPQSEMQRRASSQFREHIDQMNKPDEGGLPKPGLKMIDEDELEGGGSRILYQDDDAPKLPPGMKILNRGEVGKGTAGPQSTSGSRITAQAKEKFGTTRNYRHGGYMTPDGDLLDFKGTGATARGESEFRGLDHGDVQAITDPERKAGRAEGILKFMEDGNIRLTPENGKFQISRPLSTQQKGALNRWLQNFKDKGFSVEVGYAGITPKDQAFTRQYPAGASPQRVFEDLDNHFSGQKPRAQSDMQRFRSESDNTLYQEDDGPGYASAAGLPKGREEDPRILKAAAKAWKEKGTKSPFFKRWFGKSKVVDEDGKPMVVYHGTTHNFTEFDRDKANIESHYGRGNYFSDSQHDVSKNYAGVGPDLANRIEQRAERIAQDQDISMEKATKLARKELIGGKGKTLEVYLKMENPVVLMGDKETRFRINSDDDGYNETGNGVDLYYAIQRTAGWFDGEAQEIWQDIMENIPYPSDFTAREFEEAARKSEKVVYLEDENGNLASNEFIKEVYRAAGFDGIIMDADASFGFGRKLGKKMDMDYGTKHYIAFDPEQIKSATGNRGTFDPKTGNILKQKGPTLASGPKGQIQRKRHRSVITLFEGRADVTTWMHEHGHWLRSDVLSPEESKKALEWAGGTSWDRADEEKFARGFERYLYNGVAPRRDLAPAFATLKKAFREVYQDAQGTKLAEDIPPEMKAVYDALLLRNTKIRNPSRVMRLVKSIQRGGRKAGPQAVARLMAELKKELMEKEEK